MSCMGVTTECAISTRRNPLVRALRDAGNNAVSYFITTAGHSSFEPETDIWLRTIMNELPPMTSPETASLQCGQMMRHPKSRLMP